MASCLKNSFHISFNIDIFGLTSVTSFYFMRSLHATINHRDRLIFRKGVRFR